MGSNPIFATPRSIAVSRTLALRLTWAKISASLAESSILAFFLPPVKKLLNFEPFDSRASGTRTVSWLWVWLGGMATVAGPWRCEFDILVEVVTIGAAVVERGV